MRRSLKLMVAVGVLLGMGGLAFAQQEPPEKIPFAGGTLTITETEDLDKIVAFDGQELARNYMVFYDKTVEVAGLPVALVSVGDGGNACGAATLIVWKPEGEGIKSQIVGEDCGSPPAAVTDQSIYFVPYVLPGETENGLIWTPSDGLKVNGAVTFIPQPGTTWASFDPKTLDNISDALSNEEIYNAAKAMLGEEMTAMVTSLLVGGGYETTASGVIYSSGCIPHACGSSDGFMGVDQKGKKLYFAHGGEDQKAWPPVDAWPADLRDVMTGEISFQP